MADTAPELPTDPVIMVTNADVDCSPESFHAFLNDLLAGPEPDLESIDASDALRELRVDAGA